MKKVVLIGWCLLVGATLPSSQAAILISEFLAINNSGLPDEDGTRSDWIEIHNATASPVNLAGWFLTDDPDTLNKWSLPATNLPAGGFLVVFASGKNRTLPGSPLHANFSLSGDGEYLALVQPDGVTITAEYAPAFPPQFDNISYGVTATNATVQKFFALATPGAPNASSYYAQATVPHCHPDRGFYTNGISVTITSAVPAAVIRYTLNGTVPTATNGLIYSNPIGLTNTTVVRAVALETGATPSAVVTYTYIFATDVPDQSTNGTAPPGWPASWGDNVVDYGMDPDITRVSPWSNAFPQTLLAIPTISLVMPLSSLFDASTGIYANPEGAGIDWERAASVELLSPEGDHAKQFQINVGARIRGGFSRSTDNPKHSFRFLCRAEYGQNRLDYPLFGPTAARSFDNFDLRSHQDDAWHMRGVQGEIIRDSFSRDTQMALGQVAKHGNFHHVYINGQYWGVFATEERPEASFGESYFGGDNNNYDVVKVDRDLGYNVTTTDGDLTAWLKLWQAGTNGFASAAAYQKVQGNNPDGTPNPNYENLLDVANLIDYMLVIVYTGNIDAPISAYAGNLSINNWYGLRERSGQFGGFRFIVHDSENTLYDLDEDRTGPFPAGDPAHDSHFGKSNPQYLWQQLAANAEFRVLVSDHIQRHFFNNGALTPAAVTNRYLARRNEIEQAIVAESARWGDAKREPPFTYDDWRATSDGLLTNYFPYRTAIVFDQLRAKNLYPNLGAPIMNQFGGPVPAGFTLTLTHTNPTGTIYFTTDGSDPRLLGGVIATNAESYETALTIVQPTRIRARVKNGATWSALSDATFTPPQDLTKLVLTEVMYNPPPFQNIAGNDLEFLELKNDGPNALNLSGLTFSAGITYTFGSNTLLAPGNHLVLARNAGAFNVKYPGVTIQGTYTGQLDNSGETLTLSFPGGGLVFSFSYDDQAPWPITADGHGFSLVPRQPGLTAAPDTSNRWRASAQSGGSPGADDLDPELPPIVINEILAHTDLPQRDAIELYNPTATNVNVSGWYLSDNATLPQKYRLPEGSLIPAHGYLSFDDSQFNSGTAGNTAFLFASTGEEIYLTSASASTALTGYSHGFVFGASFNGVSFGRYENSDGEESFPAQTSVSLGTTNVSPRVGPIVINEIHYHPDNAAGDEFIELLNSGDTNVPLFHPAFPTNTWRFTGLNFSFPPNASLAPAALALVTPLAPEVFRAKYGIATNVQIFGPYTGALDNSGERLSLEVPDNPNLDITPYVSIEEIRYNDKSPWPVAADGGGMSLQRQSAGAYGSEPTNWIAAVPTPGQFSLTADLDDDGLPDGWELASGTNWKVPDADADPDNDGMNNWAEYLSGTQPLEATSVLRLQIQSGTNGTNGSPWLELQALANRTYSVLHSTNLTEWSKFVDVAVATSNRLVQIPLPDTEAAQFFKLTTPALLE